MAQANINLRSITPAFRGVQSALQDRARLARSAPPSGLGTATAISGAVKDIAVEERGRQFQEGMVRLRAELQSEADEANRTFQKRFDVGLKTEKDLEEAAEALDIDKEVLRPFLGVMFKDQKTAEKSFTKATTKALGLEKSDLEQRELGAVEAPTPGPIADIAGDTRIPIAQPTPHGLEGDVTGTQAGLPTNEQRLENLESRIEILDPTQPAAAAKVERSTAKLFEKLSPSDRALAESDPEKAIELLQKARFAPKQEKEKRIKALPSFANKKLNELGGLSRLAQKAIDTFDPSFVGPIQGPLGQGIQKFSGPFASKERATFLQGVAGLRNATIKAISGGAVTPSEAERLVQQLPDINTTEIDFETKLRNYSEELNSIIQDNVASFKASGFSGVDELTPSRIISRQERVQQTQQREVQAQENQIRNTAFNAITIWNRDNPDKKIKINETTLNNAMNRIKERTKNAQR